MPKFVIERAIPGIGAALGGALVHAARGKQSRTSPTVIEHWCRHGQMSRRG